LRLVIALEHRFDRTPDGAVWTQIMFPYAFWGIYLDVFDQVRVVARVQDVASPQPDWIRADGEGVSFHPIPYFLGPRQYLLNYHRVKSAARSAVGQADAVILHLPSAIATHIETLMRKTDRPYGVEVVGDPYDAFSPGSCQHPLRAIFRTSFYYHLKKQCARAPFISYVTEQALQRRYPPDPNAYATFYTFNVLKDNDIVSTPRPSSSFKNPLTLINVGSFNHLQKAQDIIIEAFANCIKEGLDLNLVMVGDGALRLELEARVQTLGIGKRVRFLGQVTTGAPFQAELDKADIFLLPSRQEGLPRALVEAMARALPCIGSTVGGIPELLPLADLVPSGDVAALTKKIRETTQDFERLDRMSSNNLEKSREFRDEVLKGRRGAFYQSLRDKTEEWLTLTH
jgi:glycosyltransferase involved in cell wall biosynthesis